MAERKITATVGITRYEKTFRSIQFPSQSPRSPIATDSVRVNATLNVGDIIIDRHSVGTVSVLYMWENDEWMPQSIEAETYRYRGDGTPKDHPRRVLSVYGDGKLPELDEIADMIAPTLTPLRDIS